jgi:hypothetical protein
MDEIGITSMKDFIFLNVLLKTRGYRLDGLYYNFEHGFSILNGP